MKRFLFLLLLALAGCGHEIPQLPQPLVPLADAPTWCAEEGYPKGDHWYENCVQPRAALR